MPELKRRTFLKTTIAAAGSIVILPTRVWANPPNSKVCTAHIGIGGKGRGDLGSIARHPKAQVIGLCDVDTAHGRLAEHKKKHGSATFYKDYREMLGELGDKIDAVGICTPDFTHYPATLLAMNAGKHVYTQKPLVVGVALAGEQPHRNIDVRPGRTYPAVGCVDGYGDLRRMRRREQSCSGGQ